MSDDPGAILVVEDEPTVRQSIVARLQQAGYHTIEADSVDAAKRRVRSDRVALVILDIGLPDGSGLDLLRSLELPAIVVSGQTSEADRVTGLELGADDYVIKPFSSRELLARVRCVLRRTGAPEERTADGALCYPRLLVDPASREVLAGGVQLHLTRIEFDLLYFMASHPRHVFTKSHLLERVWLDAGGWTTEATVTEHVRRLRKKLGADAGVEIVTVWGVGYRFEPDSGQEPADHIAAAADEARLRAT